MVEDLVDLFAEVEQEDIPALPFNRRTRMQCARAMRELARLTKGSPHEGCSDGAVSAACSAVDELHESLAEDPSAGGSDPFVAGSIVTVLRRCLGAIASCGGPTAVARNRSLLFR